MMKAIKTDGILALIDIDRSVAKMAENKIADVAAIFNKELDEEFRVKDLTTGKIYVASFCNYGMRAYVEGFPHSEKPRWDMIMRLILGGSAVIVDE